MTRTAALLLSAVAAAFFALPELGRRPSPSGPRTRAVETYVVPGDFLITTRDGRLALFGIGLRLTHAQRAALNRSSTEGKATLLADGASASPADLRLRRVIAAVITVTHAGDLRPGTARRRVERRLRLWLTRGGDVSPARVFFTDLALR